MSRQGSQVRDFSIADVPEPASHSQDVQRLLRQYGLRPDKRLGQNFLIDSKALEKVASSAEITPAETVLEIGAGLGGLTLCLAKLARLVVAVEIDERLAPPLRSTLQGIANVRLVLGDILALDPARLLAETSDLPYVVTANIPYYITSALIRHLLEARTRPSRMVLTVQEEVAERICAGAGKLSLLALSVQVYGNPRQVGRIPAGAFYPAPKVDSAIVRVDMYPQPVLPNLSMFFRLAKAGFSQKRKTLRNSLAGGMGWSTAASGDLLTAAGIDPFRRAETLNLEEWQALVEAAQQSGSGK